MHFQDWSNLAYKSNEFPTEWIHNIIRWSLFLWLSLLIVAKLRPFIKFWLQWRGMSATKSFCNWIKDLLGWNILCAYGEGVSPKQGHILDGQKNEGPFLSACYARTQDNRDAQPLPTKMLELLFFIPTIRFQLQYPHQMIWVSSRKIFQGKDLDFEAATYKILGTDLKLV